MSPRTDDVPAAVAAWCARPGTPGRTRELAFDQCKAAHMAMCDALERDGHDVAVWRLVGPIDPLPDADARWLGLDAQRAAARGDDHVAQQDWVHYVAQVDGVFVDLTARQFDPQAAWPARVDVSRWRSAVLMERPSTTTTHHTETLQH